jgi:hypothetical protein
MTALTQADIEALPNYRKKTAKEWSSTCPECGGEDRFLFWPEKKNYWCRQCGLEGFVKTDADALFRITPEMKEELERQRIAREIEEYRQQQTAIEQLQSRRMDIIYHGQLTEYGFDGVLDANWGIAAESSTRFHLGYCNTCPTYHQSDSLTIPYYWGDKLVNIRHRLLHPNGCGKYRPEMAGLPSAIFNANRLMDELEYLILVEGEFKAIVLEQAGFPAIAIPGANQFKDKWTRLFHRADMVYIALDPGAETHAWQTGVTLSRSGCDVRICEFPVKPDDFFTVYNGTALTFKKYLEQGRKC